MKKLHLIKCVSSSPWHFASHRNTHRGRKTLSELQTGQVHSLPENNRAAKEGWMYSFSRKKTKAAHCLSVLIIRVRAPSEMQNTPQRVSDTHVHIRQGQENDTSRAHLRTREGSCKRVLGCVQPSRPYRGRQLASLKHFIIQRRYSECVCKGES